MTPPRRSSDDDRRTTAPGRARGGRSGLADAQAYSPRASTMREAAQRGSARDEQGVAGRPAGSPERRAAGRRGGAEGRTSVARRSPVAARTPVVGRSPDRQSPDRQSPDRQSPDRRSTDRGDAAERRAAAAGRTTERRATPTRRVPRQDERRRTEARPAPRGAGGTPGGPGRKRSARFGNPHRRLRAGTAVLLLLLCAVAGRILQIQTVDARAWAAQAEQDRLYKVVLEAPRGSILDRSGATLAQSLSARTITADPSLVKNPAGTAAKLAPLLGVPAGELEAKLARKKYKDGKTIRFVYLARRLDPQVGEAVKELDLAGILQEEEERRDVPGKTLAANIIGFTGIDGSGLAGMESRYDDVLAGKDGVHQYEVGRDGAAIPGGVDLTTPAAPGRDLELTIDRDLQYEAQRILGSRMKAVKGLTGTAIVLDRRTAEVFALASYPSFDASDPGSSPVDARLDLATGAVVEPGSVHKAITIGAGLEAGVVKPNSVVPVAPSITKGGTTFRDTHAHSGTVGLTLQGILAQSSNVGTIEIADKLGPQRLYEFQRKFGLGAKTGVGLPGESSGIVQPPANWSGPAYGGVPIGLGVAVTPLQMASAYQAIANDGVRVEPRAVRGTIGPDGKLTPAAAPKSTRVLSAANAAALRVAMEGVATSEGTAPLAAIPGYRVAGKTGTGQRVMDNRYLPGNVASFIGMAPADAPRFVVAVFVHTPAGVGGAIAGPVFHDLMSFALRHFDVPPTGSKAPAIRLYG